MAMSIDWEAIRTAADDTETRKMWRALNDLNARLSALETAAPKPEREPGWYVVQRKGEWSPNALWWNGSAWQFCPPDVMREAMRATAEWIGPRLDLPAEKVT